MRKYGKGSITIWLAVVLCVILSLVTACIQSARLSAARAFVSVCMDESLFSEFARYDRILYEHYGLLAVDGGFGSGSLDFASVAEEIGDAAKELVSTGGDLFRLSLTETDITGYVLATDSAGAPLTSQISELMKRKLGADGVNRLAEMVSTNRPVIAGQEAAGQADPEEIGEVYEQQKQLAAERAEAARAAAEEASDPENTGEAAAEIAQETVQPVEIPEDFVNPLDNFQALLKMGIYNVILPDPTALSNLAIDRNSLPENRTLQQGMGILPEHKESVPDHFLLAAYITDFFSHFCSPKEQEGIRYQAEFAIAGKGSDAENLKSVLNRILLIRMGLNYLYLETDSAKKAEAEGVALIIASLLLSPEAYEMIAQILLFAWAYVESMVDLKTLLAGGKEPVFKDASTWQLSLEGMASLSSDTPVADSRWGLSYQDYLILLLCMLPEETLTNRALDLLEYNRRILADDPLFQIDACFTAIETEMFGSAAEYEFSVRRGYGYDLYTAGSGS